MQPPQQIISPLARDRRTWFVEEPSACDVEGADSAVKVCLTGLVTAFR